jgi:flavorubredoxin
MTAFSAVPVAENVFWVGAIDWSLREFHGYNTGRGTTYNAYLVLADKITLIDTVKRPFFNEMMERIASVVDPEKIEYIVSNHAEMDHSGCLPEAVRAIRPAKVFASAQGVKALQEHFGAFTELTEVKDTETLSLGDLSLTFFETRMLHWPDSMVSYLPERRLLFSQDAFGMHLASSERFGDELPENILVAEGEKYFANILMPYAQLIHKAVKRLTGAGIEIEIIAPDHGPICARSPSGSSGNIWNGPIRNRKRRRWCSTTPCGGVPRKWLRPWPKGCTASAWWPMCWRSARAIAAMWPLRFSKPAR